MLGNRRTSILLHHLGCQQDVRHARQIIFQMAEVAIPRELFRAILERIGRLRLPTPQTS
jgi:hypothetical protein